MVQYITTPWRDRRELLAVRRQFYPDNATAADQSAADAPPGQRHAARPPPRAQRDGQHQAVARVALWMQRGNCPHMVESTALLMAAILADEQGSSGGGSSSSSDDCDTEELDHAHTSEAQPPRRATVPSSSYSTSSSSYASRAAYSAAFSR
jgi:hypothetical protein